MKVNFRQNLGWLLRKPPRQRRNYGHLNVRDRQNGKRDKSYVAPTAKTSAVLALLSVETSIVKRATATMMTAALLHRCWTKLRMRAGTRSKTITSHAMTAREMDVILVPTGMKTFGSLDKIDWGCYTNNIISKGEDSSRKE